MFRKLASVLGLADTSHHLPTSAAPPAVQTPASTTHRSQANNHNTRRRRSKGAKKRNKPRRPVHEEKQDCVNPLAPMGSTAMTAPKEVAEDATKLESQRLSLSTKALSELFLRACRLHSGKRRGKQTNHLTAPAMELINSLYESLVFPVPPAGTVLEHTRANAAFSQCQVCYCDFDQPTSDQKQNSLEENLTLPLVMQNCGHAVTCADCFSQYVQHRIKDGDVLPWLHCPAEQCKTPVHSEHLQTLTPALQLDFVMTVCQKNLARDEDWVPCNSSAKKDGCAYGFLVSTINKEERTCEVCQQKQTVQKRGAQLDNTYKELQKSGVLRPCPKCSALHMKDYGLCNVMQCWKCSIWWNWRSRDIGASSQEVKNRARANGTMWEPGELQYQQKLQRNEPEKFKELLERNGIQYRSNYVRGSG